MEREEGELEEGELIEDDVEEGEVKEGKGAKATSCQVCCQAVSKYKCPKCTIRFCSVECCKTHKLKNQCSGIRDKSTFLELSELKDEHLHQDFQLLQSGIELTGRSKRKRVETQFVGVKKLKTKPGAQTVNKNKSLNLISKARKRDVLLKTLPQFMTRHVENSSFYNTKKDFIAWHIELRFLVLPQKLNHGNFSKEIMNPNLFFILQIKKLNEKTLMRDVLTKTLDKMAKAEQYLHFSTKFKEKETSIKMLMKKESTRADRPLWYEIDYNKSISENLALREVIEFPIFYVIETQDLPLFDTTDENLPPEALRVEEKKPFEKTSEEEQLVSQINNEKEGGSNNSNNNNNNAGGVVAEEINMDQIMAAFCKDITHMSKKEMEEDSNLDPLAAQ